MERLRGADEAERAGDRGDRHHRRHHLRPQRRRRPHGEDADDRRVHQRRGEAEAADDDDRRGPRHRDREEVDRDRHREDREGGHLLQIGLRRELLRRERAEQRADAKPAEEEAGDMRVVVVVEVRERLHADDRSLRDEVDRAGGEEQRPEQRVVREESQPGEEALRLGRLLDAAAGANHGEDREEREDVRSGVDDEHGRSARRRDQYAGEHRPGDLRQLVRAGEDGADLRDGALVLARDLRDDDPRRGEVRRREAADRERRGEDGGEREVVRPEEDRQDGEQRPACGVGEEHRPLRPEPGDQGPRRDAEQPDRRHLRREHPAHLRGRARRDEDEPGQRDERHRGARERDELGGEQAAEGAVAPDHGRNIKRPYGFVKWAMPKVSREHVEARRAQILEGARRAFSRYGYEGATVARIEEETGLSRGAIFNYFDGKLDLFVAARARREPALHRARDRARRRRRHPRDGAREPGVARRHARDAGEAPPRPGVRAADGAAGRAAAAAPRLVPGRGRRTGRSAPTSRCASSDASRPSC